MENTLSHYVKSSNYEYHRCKYKHLDIDNDDIYVDGNFIINYAPCKKKIDKKKLFKRKNVGRSLIRYKNGSALFFVNNKLKFIDVISNRVVMFNELTFKSHSETIKIKHCETGINKKRILESFIRICNGKKPKNIFTKNVILCELMSFIISEYIHSNYFENEEGEIICIHHISSDNFEFNNNNNIINNKIKYKTHKILLNNNNNNNNNDDDDDNDDNDDDNNNDNNYAFKDQSIVIIDNNYNYKLSPQISINIPKSIINKKIFRNRINNYNNNNYNYDFIKSKTFLLNLKTSLDRYFQ